jgi:chromosome segregation ATPase
MNVKTQVAELLHQTHYYNEGQGEVAFYLSGLKRHPDLLSQVSSLYDTYKQREVVDKAADIAALEEKLDRLIEASRKARAKVSAVENEQLEAARKHANAESALTNRSSECEALTFGIRNSVGLFTRAELADRQSQIDKAKQLVEKAAFAESYAVTEFRTVIGRLDEARAAWQAAIHAANDCKGELNRLLGKKDEDSEDYSQTGLAMG